jgi:hypothetical protein
VILFFIGVGRGNSRSSFCALPLPRIGIEKEMEIECRSGLR